MNKFTNLVVHLNEDNIEEVKELLLSKGEKIEKHLFYLSVDVSENYLFYNRNDKEWQISFKSKDDKEITLEEFKRLINEK